VICYLTKFFVKQILASAIDHRSSNDKSRSQIKEADDERSGRINSGFNKIIEFVNILGQMDNFVYDKTRNIISKLNAMYHVKENERYGRFRSKS